MKKMSPAWLTGLANAVALGCLIPPVVVIGLTPAGPTGEPRTPATQAIVAGPGTAKPDIYYVGFDRYGDDATARAYGFHNDVSEYLRGRGFYVAPASRSNYIKTVLSLASSLNADYLDDVVRGREHTQNW